MGGCAGKARRNEEEELNFKGGNVHIITSKESWDQKIAEANRDGKTVVANFSASWCGPCRVIAPVYAEMSKTYPQLMFLSIDVDDLLVSQYYIIKISSSLQGNIYMSSTFFVNVSDLS